MNALIILGIVLIAVGLGLLLCIIALSRAILDLSVTMPVMHWMTFKEVLALKCCGDLLTRWALLGLIVAEVAEVRLNEVWEEHLIELRLTSWTEPPGKDVEITVELNIRNIHYFDFRLRFRPRRKRKVKREAESYEPRGGFVPA